MRKLFLRNLPGPDTVKQNRWLRPFGARLLHPKLWHLHRRSVAGGVAVGLFCGLVPGPLQMISAALLAMLFRVNLPVALITTLYTNPFTIVPLYLLAFRIGAWVSGARAGETLLPPPFPELHWHDFIGRIWDWMVMLGQPFLMGLPMLGASLAILGYVGVRVMWRIAVLIRWRARARHNRARPD